MRDFVSENQLGIGVSENNPISSEEGKEFIYDASIKKKNNFWCTSTFCIPWTKQVNRNQRNIVNRTAGGGKVPPGSLFDKDDNQYKTTVNVRMRYVLFKTN